MEVQFKQAPNYQGVIAGLIRNGHSVEAIAQQLGLSVEQVRGLG